MDYIHIVYALERRLRTGLNPFHHFRRKIKGKGIEMFVRVSEIGKYV